MKPGARLPDFPITVWRKDPAIPRAFSLTELVIVIVILGVVTAIAIPRFSIAAENARASALLADSHTLQAAIEHYAAEHMGRSPAQNPDQSQAGPAVFTRRLLETTDEDGRLNAAGLYGPYLRSMPTNAVNGLALLRIGGGSPGDNSAGWYFDPVTLEVVADDSPESAAATRAQTRTEALIERMRRR